MGCMCESGRARCSVRCRGAGEGPVAALDKAHVTAPEHVGVVEEDSWEEVGDDDRSVELECLLVEPAPAKVGLRERPPIRAFPCPLCQRRSAVNRIEEQTRSFCLQQRARRENDDAACAKSMRAN